MAFEYGRLYPSSQLPDELIHVPSGEVRYYEGIPYRVISESGGRRLEAPSGTETGLLPEHRATAAGADKTAPPFKFDWEAARLAMFDPANPEKSQLGKYYLQKLKDADFDTERAKRLIEEDYKRGVRIATEDYTLTERRGREDLASQLAQFGLESKEETREAIGGANRRGVLFGEIAGGGAKAPYSEYAKEYILSPMEERQRLRKEAIERAVQRQIETAGIEKERETSTRPEALGRQELIRQRGIEEQVIQQPRTKQELEEETRREAYNVQVPIKYTEEYEKYRAAQGLPTR